MKRLLFGLTLCLAIAGAGVYGASHPAVPKEMTSYRDVVKRVLPAVVSIEARQKAMAAAAGLPRGFRSPFGHLPLPDQAPRHAFGSGFVVDPAGVICTNAHVVDGADEVEVQLQDGRKFTSRDIKRDPKTDLAIVRVEVKEPLPTLSWGDSNALEVGDRVLAVGAPLGLRGTVTSGIISAKGRDVHMNLYEDFLQTDAAINPGNSGGPLVNLAGEVVGVNSAIKSETGGFQGIGLAISSKLAQGVLGQLLTDGAVHRGYLGVQVQPLDAEVAARLGLPGKSGVVVGKVMPGSPAAQCGLQDGDVLTQVAGQPVDAPQDLQRVVAGLTIGKQVELTVYRDGARKLLTITVAEQPETFGTATDFAEPGATSLGKIGVKVTELTAEKARELGYPDRTEGVLITEVEPDGVAHGAGLRSGTLVLGVDQQKVKTVEEFRKAVQNGSLDKGVLLQVRTPHGGTTYVLLKAPSAP
jgi:serine protease Do